MAKSMIRICAAFLIIAVFMLLIGCNAVIGAGKDISAFGEGGKEFANWTWNKASNAMKASSVQPEQEPNSDTEPFYMEVSVN